MDGTCQEGDDLVGFVETGRQLGSPVRAVRGDQAEPIEGLARFLAGDCGLRDEVRLALAGIGFLPTAPMEVAALSSCRQSRRGTISRDHPPRHARVTATENSHALAWIRKGLLTAPLPDGRVKVLDFGLAKLREVQVEAHASAAADDVTRMPSGDLTGKGPIIGTVAYMSPEIKRGLPDGLAKVIRRSLAKDRSRRYQTATDLRNELEELKQEVDSGIHLSTTGARASPHARPASRRPYLPAAVAAAMPLAAGAAYVAWTSRAAGSGPAALESGTTRPFGSVPGPVFGGAASRDGERLVSSRGEVLVDVARLTRRKASDQ